jgi:hypothetical protein
MPERFRTIWEESMHPFHLFRPWARMFAMVATLVATVAPSTPGDGVAAAAQGYVFELLAQLGGPAPGGGIFVNDFEPGGLNKRGSALFGADLSTGGEGVFLLDKRGTSPLARTGNPAPGGGVFEFLFLGSAALNHIDDAAFAFTLSPFSLPVGVNSGLYRFSSHHKIVTPVVVPFVTPSPTGDVFQGVFFAPSLNSRGDIVFPGIIKTDKGIHVEGQPDTGLGIGLFRATKAGVISSVVVPGDPAPGGGTFDVASFVWTNDYADVAFSGHVAGEECLAEGFAPQDFIMGCLGSLYLKDAGSRQIKSIAHAGDPAPGGGVFRQATGPVMNKGGDIVFLGDLTPPPTANSVIGVFLYSKGELLSVARPGDAMPGGGHLVTASAVTAGQIHINLRGEVAFNATLDTDVDGDGTADTGLYVWSKGSLRLVARSGTVIDGVGTIAHLVMNVIVVPPPPVLVPNSGAIINDEGLVLFGATLTDGRGVMLRATPQ